MRWAVSVTMRQLMRERRKLAVGDDDNFNIFDTQQLAETLSSTMSVLTRLLGAVAAVSLMVGGIGIMNIMLVSVTERTREIGLRLAVGALKSEVLMQFLIEAVVLSALGGAESTIIATAVSYWLARDERALQLRRNDQHLRAGFLGGDRRGIWLLPRAPGRPTGSDRSAAAQIMSMTEA